MHDNKSCLAICAMGLRYLSAFTESIYVDLLCYGTRRALSVFVPGCL